MSHSIINLFDTDRENLATLADALQDAGYYRRTFPKRLHAYGNMSLLTSMAFYVPDSLCRKAEPKILDKIEQQTEAEVLNSGTLVTSYMSDPQQRAAIIPLRYGCPRILIIPCGLYNALGPDLRDEPFRAARLWRYSFAPETDLALSFSPDHGGLAGAYNERINRAVVAIATYARARWEARQRYIKG